MKTNQIMKQTIAILWGQWLVLLSIHKNKERAVHRDYQTHTAKTGKDRIPTTVYLAKNLMS